MRPVQDRMTPKFGSVRIRCRLSQTQSSYNECNWVREAAGLLSTTTTAAHAPAQLRFTCVRASAVSLMRHTDFEAGQHGHAVFRSVRWAGMAGLSNRLRMEYRRSGSMMAGLSPGFDSLSLRVPGRSALKASFGEKGWFFKSKTPPAVDGLPAACHASRCDSRAVT